MTASGGEREGVVRFRAEHATEPLPARQAARLAPLLPWRRVLWAAGLLGQDPRRYGGYGYGNVSVRAAGEGFLISGTQTSGAGDAGPERFAWITGWSVDGNRVASRGPVPPSSEALSHAVLYETSPAVGAVFHVHAPTLYRAAARLGLPATAEAEAGTPAMAREVGRVLRHGAGSGSAGVVVMGGHPDGLLVYGGTAEEAGRTLVRLLAAAARLGSGAAAAG